MATVTVTRVSGLSFVGVDSTGHSLLLAPPDQHAGLKPSDLLLLALGGCTAVDVAGILAKQRQPVSDFRVVVEGEQAADPPWTFERIHVVYEVEGAGLRRAAVERAVQLSETTYCSVWSTLAGRATITSEVRIVEPAPAAGHAA
jgi:putative redox protein